MKKSKLSESQIVAMIKEGDAGIGVDDFYQAWYPTQEMQRFPVPVRVINATNINNPQEVFSIGLTWVANKEEEQGLWDYIKKATRGEDKDNETRHERIEKVADGELLGLFKVKSDDNLDEPF